MDEQKRRPVAMGESVDVSQMALSRSLVRIDQLSIIATAMLSVFLLVAAIAAAATVKGVVGASDRAERALLIRDMARKVYGQLQAVERGQRGYLITEDKDYLVPFNRARDEIDADVAKLRTMVAANPAQTARLDRFTELAKSKFEEMQRTVDAADSGDFATARKIIDADIGLALMGKIETVIDDMINDETTRLVHDQRAAENRTKLLAGLVGLALLITAALAALAIISSRRAAHAAGRRSLLLDELNQILEERVAARTADVESARKAAEHERERVELLLKDLNHRIGNNLAMVSALLGMQSAKVTDERAKTALLSARERVFLIGSAQRRLRLATDFQSAEIGPFFSDVIADILGAVSQSQRPAVHQKYEKISVDSRDAVTLAVVLGELITNAVKHAFNNVAAPEIWVSFGKFGDGSYALQVEDNGVGVDAQAGSEGLGYMVLDQFSKHFGGEIKKSERPGGGLTVTVTLPKLEPAIS